MQFAAIDWGILLAYLALALAIGLYFRRFGGKSLQNFFLGGRKLSWWLAGTSMVATTFAADTPLLVTELVRKEGISGNWLWWNMLIGGMLTTFFFARLWRRSGVTTDLEFISLRYSGRPAHFLRGLRAVYMGVFLNVIIIGWVNLAMLTLLQGFFPDWSAQQHYLALGAIMLLTMAYASMGGLRSVVVTDAVQFVLAMAGSVALAWLVLSSPEVGGISGLKDRLTEAQLSFFPEIGQAATGEGLALGVGAFLTMAALQWWASWYPGAEPGGGGYVAQRMMASRSEADAVGATFLFQLFHYALRPWPWILVGLATFVLYPGLSPDNYRSGYVYAMRDFLPPGALGLLAVAFLAAYMSTLSTQLNWGVSYLMNDFLKPYALPRLQQQEKKAVRYSRLLTVLLAVLAFGVTPLLTSIQAAWEFLLTCGAGLGLFLILRWYWHRVTAWAEILATLVPLAVYPLLLLADAHYSLNHPDAFFGKRTLFVLVTAVTVFSGMLAITFLPRTNEKQLKAFYLKVRPLGLWPRHFQNIHPTQNRKLLPLLADWVLGIVSVYGTLFGIGKLVLAETATAVAWFVPAILCGALLALIHRKFGLFRDE